MVFVTTSGGSLCLSPWKDGLKPSEVARQSKNIHSVLIIFPGNDDNANDENILDERGLMKLFQVLAKDMPQVRSITIAGGNRSHSGGPSKMSRRRNMPPLKAITSLLCSESSGLIALCLVNIPLLGSYLDRKNFTNAIRVHPTLHSFDCTGCVFEERAHMNVLKESCRQKRLDHFFLDSEYILEEQEGEEEEEEEDTTILGALTFASEGSGWWPTLSYPHHLCFCI
ncbi:MAG: hypothetical protein SGBAC_005872 [Bacillariaceae sp.]